MAGRENDPLNVATAPAPATAAPLVDLTAANVSGTKLAGSRRS